MSQTVITPDTRPDREPDRRCHFERPDGADIDVEIYQRAHCVEAIVVVCDGREWLLGVHDNEAVLREMPPVWLCRVAFQLGLDGARKIARREG